MLRVGASGLVFFVLACGRIDFDPDSLVCSTDDQCPATEACRSQRCVAWFDRSFGVRSRLDLDRYTPAMPLPDFPIMVALDPSRFERSLASADLQDVTFVLDGRILPRELEDTGTTVIAWVRLPATTPGPIYVYYGALLPSPATDKTWPEATYVGVWHLADGVDSARTNNGVLAAATPTAGRIGAGLQLALGAGHVRVPDAATTHWTTGNVTASGWMFLRSQFGAYSTVVSRELAGSLDEFAVGENLGQLNAEIQTSAGGQLLEASTLTIGEWHHVAVVYDGASVRAYLDGMMQIDQPQSGSLTSASNPIIIGADCNSGSQVADTDFVDGIVDEVRIETVARPPEWIRAELASQTDAWITYGPIER